MQLNQLVPELVVDDVNASIEFYTRKLGFEVVLKVPEEGKPVWAELKNGETSLMLQETKETFGEIPLISDRKTGGTTLLVFRLVTSQQVRQIWSSLSTNSQVVLPLRETDYGTVEFGITDPDGYVIIFAGE